jgi:nucleotide-binding universal stress UspA family protein
LQVLVGTEPWTFAPDYVEAMDKVIIEASDRIIKSARSKLRTAEDKTLKVSTEIIQGSPRQVIVDEAEEWGADLIVMGSRGLAAWNRLLMGSFSNAVVHHAKCLVEIVRKAKQ